MLAGLLLLGKGDRVAMNSSVEARYPLLDDDVIAFCASIAPEYKLRGADRQMAAAPGGRANAAGPDRQPAQDDVPRQPVRGVSSTRTARAGSTSSSAPSRSRRRAGSIRRASRASAPPRCASPRITPKRIIMDLSLTCVIATQLWHHIYLGGGLCELPTWESSNHQVRELASADRPPPPAVADSLGAGAVSSFAKSSG